MTLYCRAGTYWQRRKSYTDAAEVWVRAKRVPLPVRKVAESYSLSQAIEVEFDNITRTAYKREEWRVR